MYWAIARASLPAYDGMDSLGCLLCWFAALDTGVQTTEY